MRALGGWWSRRRRRTKLALLGSVLVVFGGFVGLCAIVYSAVRIPLPANVALPQQIVVTYSSGQRLDTIGSVNRTDVDLAQVPVGVRRAVLAAEDRHFYSEPGISVRGIGRALVADVSGGGIKQGGSTITQQYAKNAYLGQSRTFTRKIKEIALAVKISRTYSKDQVLGFYLNTIYFGRGAYGIQAAGEAYFGVPVQQLTTAQGAVLAGLIRAPSVLDPRVSPNAARTRWSEVMDQLVADKALSAADRASTAYPVTVPIQTAAARAAQRGPRAYIDDQVATFVKGQLGDARVALGGLTVTTTIDETSQAAAEAAVAAQSVGAPPDQRAALIALDPRTGAIRAYYGGTQAGRLDAVSSLTQPPGSAFKPLTLAAALQNGASLDETLDGSSPQTFGSDVVRNFDNEQFGRVSLRTATADSINTAYVHLAQDTGPAKVVALARTLGVPATVQLDAVPEIALGPNYVHALDMARAYTAFANEGATSAPYFVQKITDRKGNVLYEARPEHTQVLSAQTADDVTTALRGVLTGGTAVGSQLASGRPAAGKTGTTSGTVPNIAAWFDGYTPQLLTVVAFTRPGPGGALQSLTPYPACSCGEVTGATLPAQTWKRFMDAALAAEPVIAFAGNAPGPESSAVQATTSPGPSVPTPIPSARPTPTRTSTATRTTPATPAPPATTTIPLTATTPATATPAPTTPAATPPTATTPAQAPPP